MPCTRTRPRGGDDSASPSKEAPRALPGYANLRSLCSTRQRPRVASRAAAVMCVAVPCQKGSSLRRASRWQSDGAVVARLHRCLPRVYAGDEGLRSKPCGEVYSLSDDAHEGRRCFGAAPARSRDRRASSGHRTPRGRTSGAPRRAAPFTRSGALGRHHRGFRPFRRSSAGSAGRRRRAPGGDGLPNPELVMSVQPPR